MHNAIVAAVSSYENEVQEVHSAIVGAVTNDVQEVHSAIVGAVTGYENDVHGVQSAILALNSYIASSFAEAHNGYGFNIASDGLQKAEQSALANPHHG